MGGLAVLRQCPGISLFPGEEWPEAFLLVAALMVTVSDLARHVSLQNALAASCVIGGIGAFAHWSSDRVGIPFGPVVFHTVEGPSPFQEVFCLLAVVWVLMVLNARGVARLLLQAVSRHPNHGLFLLFLSLLLLLLMVMVFEPFATAVMGYWFWGETTLPISWQHVPLSCLLAWCVVGAVASFGAIPFLISKHPRPRPPSTEPAWLWILFSLLFGVGTGVAGLWPAAVMAAVNGVIGLVAIVLEKRWKLKS